MNLRRDEESRVRSYLLGELAEGDARELEERLLRNGEIVERVLLIEGELIDDYVMGGLNPAERERFERHFLTTPRRQRRLMTVEGLKRYAIATPVVERRHDAPRPRWLGLPLTPGLKAAAFAALAVLAAIVIWRAFFHQTQADRGLVALNQAYRQRRPLEARVTGMPYALFSTERGGASEGVDQRALELSRSLLLSAPNGQDPSTQHAVGRLYLTQREFDEAIKAFEDALKSAPNDAQLHADLGAALLEQAKLLRDRGEDGKAFEKLSESQTHLNAALKLNPSLAEASFNRALGLEEMMLPGQAREAWQDYLKLDAQSDWAKEAQRHLQDDSGRMGPPPQILESFLAAVNDHDEARAWGILNGSRELITRRMIPPQLAHEYAARSLGDEKAGARKSLDALLFAGELDKKFGGDAYTADLSAYYAAASTAQLRLLDEGVKGLDSGYELCLATKYDEARGRFAAARVAFESAGDEWEARLADYWIAYCLSQFGGYRESNDLLSSLSEYCERRGYKWLLAQAAGWRASNATALNEYSSAIKDYRLCLDLAEQISDTYLKQKALMGLGDSYSRLQQQEPSLMYHYRSLLLASRSNTTPRQSWRNFTYAGSALFAFKHYDAAAACINEALLLGANVNDPSLAYLQHLNLGLIYSKLGRFEEAYNQAEEGLRLAGSVQDQKSGQKPLANAILRRADIRRDAGDCGRAVPEYDRAISLYESMELDAYRYAARKGRLLCERALGDDAAVGRDLPALLALFTEHRKQIREEENRNSFFDAEQGVYDIAVEYEYERQNYLTALDYAETSRARSLLDAVRSGARVELTAAGPEVAFNQVSTPESTDEVRQHMPPGLHVLTYTLLPTKLLIWSISRDEFSVYKKDVSAEALNADVDAYVNALRAERSGPARPAAELGAKLFDVLLGSPLSTIKPGEALCVVPDKSLNRLPFAALISSDSGRYVVEDFELFYAPSLNVLWYCTKSGRDKIASAHGAVLSIGNPTFDPDTHPDLPPLRDAEREAREVARLYPGSVFLPGREATKERVLREMASAGVIHFAGHYVIDTNSPLLSKMVLAGGAGDARPDDQGYDLSAFEIVRQRLDATRLVVLSACQTGIDRYYGGEGAVGLAHAFIEAGVPLVVASQWPVDSGPTATLMVNFHRNRQAGMSTPEALQKAQIAMLTGYDETRKAPYYWAAFFCAGGYTEY
jgi:CHAT domain-containing protein/tetratricopeptide (TPR) repeat protein